MLVKSTVSRSSVQDHKIDVEVGGGGDVISVYKVWREYVPYKEFSIITPEEAFEKLKKVGIFTGIKDVETATRNRRVRSRRIYSQYMSLWVR